MEDKHIIESLKKLNEYFKEQKLNEKENLSEETIRSGYLNKVLELFGWNLSLTSEVIQEKKLSRIDTNKLKSIGSNHTKPDYRLLDRGTLRLYLDAKNVNDYTNSKEVAFQIRSYGWTSQLNFSMVSNFETFSLYDTSFKPSINNDCKYKVIHFTIEDLIYNYETFSQFLIKDKVQQMNWNLDEFKLSFEDSKNRTLDKDFLELIEKFRLKLGKDLFIYNPSLKEKDLQYYTQVIINRLIFLRILEGRNLEPKNKLLSWLNSDKGFWNNFQEASSTEYYKKYDGALFENSIPSYITLTNATFDSFIQNLYGQTPYKFEVINSEMLSEIYDLFLSETLILDSINKSVSTLKKKTSPTGSIPTPSKLAEIMVKKSLKLDEINNLEDLLKIKMLDPCAGSGAFLIAAFDAICNKAIELNNGELLEYSFFKKIMKHCIFGVDIDPVAIEVLKMTLSLKIITSSYILEEPYSNLLSDFKQNFQLGNSIVSTDIYEMKNVSLKNQEEFEQIPTDYVKLFPEVYENNGFTHILTNPPYIEPKNFDPHYPNIKKYFKKRYVSNKNKVDISLYFMERIFDLIRDSGEIAIIIQKRFFTTVYGKSIRDWLVGKGYIYEINEYMSNNIFKGKTTYIAIIYARKKLNENVKFNISFSEISKYRSNFIDVIIKKDDSILLSQQDFSEADIWSYRSFRTLKVFKNLKRGFYTISQNDRVKIIVGPQVLDKTYYVLYNVRSDDKYFYGNNKKEEKVVIEKDIGRYIYENDNVESFLDFKETTLEKVIIFPYYGNGKLIPSDILQKDFPKAYDYLLEVSYKTTVKKRVNPEEFYGYTRVQNISYGSVPKILIPMTAKRVIASLAMVPIFGDNSNTNSLVDKYNDINYLKALTLILNSETFSLLSIAKAGEASGGYFKMNKQFMENVPIPVLDDNEIVGLAELYNEIIEAKKFYLDAYGDQRKIYYSKIQKLYDYQNRKITDKYQLSEDEISTLRHNVPPDTINWLKNL